MTAAVAFAAAATPVAFADSSSLLDGSGNQGAGFVSVFDNQAAPQLAGGQILQGQGNLDPNGRAFNKGDNASVMQKNKAGGAAGNDGSASQSINHGGNGDHSLLGVVGNQLVVVWPWATGVYDNQATGQGSVGQGGLVQGNGNTFLRGMAPGTDGDVWQSNWAEGAGWNNGAADQSINHGGNDRYDLIGLIGNQASASWMASDNQGAVQLTGGQIGLAQGNANLPWRVLSPGDTGSVDQHNHAAGTAANEGTASQSIDHEGNGLSLIHGSGNQGAGTAAASDNQVVGQGAIGQGGVAQGNLNVPINVLSPGDQGPVDQTNDSSGSASNQGSATQNIVH